MSWLDRVPGIPAAELEEERDSAPLGVRCRERKREREKDTFRYDYGIANRSKRLLTTYEFALQYEKSIVFRGNGETLWELYENFARSSYFQ